MSIGPTTRRWVCLFAFVVLFGVIGRRSDAAGLTAPELQDAIVAQIQQSLDATPDKKCKKRHQKVINAFQKECVDESAEAKAILKATCLIGVAERKCETFPDLRAQLTLLYDALYATADGTVAEGLRLAGPLDDSKKKRKALANLNAGATVLTAAAEITDHKDRGKQLKKARKKLKKGFGGLLKLRKKLLGNCIYEVVPAASDRPVADIDGGADGDTIFANFELGEVVPDFSAANGTRTIVRFVDCRQGQRVRGLEFVFDGPPTVSNSDNEFFVYDLATATDIEVFFLNGEDRDPAVSGNVNVVSFMDPGGNSFVDFTSSFMTRSGRQIDSGVLVIENQ